jgi:hypothetical protein
MHSTIEEGVDRNQSNGIAVFRRPRDRNSIAGVQSIPNDINTTSCTAGGGGGFTHGNFI